MDKGAKHKVFKGRFDSKEMVNSAMFREKLNYIHNNPCALKWGLAERPEDYVHSSASSLYNGNGIYDVELIYLLILHTNVRVPDKVSETLP